MKIMAVTVGRIFWSGGKDWGSMWRFRKRTVPPKMSTTSPRHFAMPEDRAKSGFGCEFQLGCP